MYNDRKYHKSKHPNIDYNGYSYGVTLRLIVYYEIYGYDDDENVIENGNENDNYIDDKRKIQLKMNWMGEHENRRVRNWRLSW